MAYKVAPFVGAWIEILSGRKRSGADRSLPSWERGLKLVIGIILTYDMPSLPSWERGLKSVEDKSELKILESLPSWERGLKCLNNTSGN